MVQDVLDWFDEEIDFLNYGNPMQELRMAVSKSEDVKKTDASDDSGNGFGYCRFPCRRKGE